MSDLIDRQAAIDTLDSGAELLRRVLDITDIVGAEREKYKWGLELIESYISDMKALPSAQQWIPCSERLPGDDTEVFVYLFDRDSPYIAWVCDSKWYTEEFEVDQEYEPHAWMPLPKPYRIPQSETE